MTNYNDGKWHGWNGGECPVHPKSEVEFVTIDNDFSHEWTASAVDWSSDANPVVAFRVIKEHRDPSELWVYEDKQGFLYVGKTKGGVDAMIEEHGGRVFKAREVIE